MVSIKLNDETSCITISTMNRYVNYTHEIEIEKLTQKVYSGSVTQTYIHAQDLHPLSRVTQSPGSTMKNQTTQVMILHPLLFTRLDHEDLLPHILFTRFDHKDLLP